MSGQPQKGKFWLTRKLEEAMTSYWKILPQGTAVITVKKEDVQKLAVSLGAEAAAKMLGDPRFPAGEGLVLKGHILSGEEVKAFTQNGFFDEGRYCILELDSAKLAEAKGRRKPMNEPQAVKT